MTAQLKCDGLNVIHMRILRIMRDSDLLCKTMRKFERIASLYRKLSYVNLM